MKSIATALSLLTLITVSPRLAHAVPRLFDAPTLYHTDPNSHDIAVGDFNNDGIPDIVHGQDYYDYIFFHIGNDDGTFQSLFPWNIHNYGESDYIEVGDFNNDGLDDLAVLTTNITSAIRVYMSDATSDAVPNLSTTPIFFDFFSEYVSYLALADEDNDGQLDILLGGGYEGPMVMYNNGDSTFSERIAIGIASSIDVYTADLNHDGYPDFLSYWGPPAIIVTLSDGVGGYQTPDSIISETPVYHPIRLADVTADGELDLLYKTADSTGQWMEIAVSLGEGQFDTTGRYDILLPNHLTFTVADVYGDGFGDIVSVFTAGNEYAVVNNLGSLAFGAPVVYDADYRNQAMHGYDFNNDGFDDLLSIGWSAMGVYINLGDGTFPQADYFHIPPATGYKMLKMLEITSQDFDGDSYPDLAIFGQKGLGVVFDGHFLTIFYNDSTGHFRPSYDHVTLEWLGIAKQNETDHFVTGNFVGDAAADLVICGTGYYKIYTGPLSAGGTGLGELVALGGNTDKLVGVAADVERDGDLDLILSVSTDLVVKRNEGGIHDSGTTFENLVTAAITALDTLDIDGDDDLDVVALAKPLNRLFVLENDGSGAYSSRQTMQLVPSHVGDLIDVEAADFNGDGYGDAAVLWDTTQDASTGLVQPAVIILLNDGTGTLAEAGAYHHIISAKRLAVEDFDGDGDYDVALNARYPKGAAVLLNDGTGTFASTGLTYAALGPGGSILQITANDFDRDGKTDIALFQDKSDGTIGTISLLFNTGEASGLCPVTGDVDQSGSIVTSDIIYLVNFVLKGGAAPEPCMAAGDVDCSGTVVTSDIIYLVNTVLKAGSAPCDVCALIPGTWTCP